MSGLYPLYAWIRLSVTHVDPLRPPPKFPMILQLTRNRHELVGHFLLENGVEIDVVPDRAPYPKRLSAEPDASSANPGLRILEPDGKVRLTVLPAPTGKVIFYKRTKGIYGLKVDLLAQVGDSVDLLMPMFQQSRAEMDAEQALGFESAMAQAEAH